MEMKAMTVGELITYLSTFDQGLPVAYRLHSEQCLLEADDIYLDDFCLPRPDGWIQNKRPDMHTQQYLVFPGN